MPSPNARSRRDLAGNPLRKSGVRGSKLAVSLLVASIVTLGSASRVRGQDWGTPVWSDEFDVVSGTPIDPTKWGYDDGRVSGDESECLPGWQRKPDHPGNQGGNEHASEQRKLDFGAIEDGRAGRVSVRARGSEDEFAHRSRVMAGILGAWRQYRM